MRGIRAALTVIFLSVSLLSASDVLAQSPPTAAQKESARSLVLSGRKYREQGKKQAALDDFSAAWALVKNATTGHELGKQQSEMGLLVEARDTLLEVGRLPVESPENSALAKARSDAKSLADSLATSIPTLKIVIQGADQRLSVEVLLDDHSVSSELLATPLKVNPGTHRVVVRQGARSKVVETLIARAEEKELRVVLPEAESVGTNGVHWLTWTGLSLVVGGGVAGGVTGALALDRANEVAAGCPAGQCPPALHDTLDSANALAIGSTVSFAVGGAGLAAMVVGLFLPTSQNSSQDVTFHVGPSWVGVQWSVQ
jgi:hypothetical protein